MIALHDKCFKIDSRKIPEFFINHVRCIEVYCTVYGIIFIHPPFLASSSWRHFFNGQITHITLPQTDSNLTERGCNELPGQKLLHFYSFSMSGATKIYGEVNALSRWKWHWNTTTQSVQWLMMSELKSPFKSGSKTAKRPVNH